MPYICAAKGCGHNTKSRRGIDRFFRFPKVITNQGESTQTKTEDRRRQWISNIYRGDLKKINLNNTRVCSCHFISCKFFYYYYSKNTILKSIAVIYSYVKFNVHVLGAPSDLEDTLNPDWAPTQNMGHTLSFEVFLPSQIRKNCRHP